MRSRVTWTLAASALAMIASVHLPAQTNRDTPWNMRTPWGDPELQGEWTTEGEYDPGVFEYACHEGNYGLEHMLRTSRLYDR